MHALAQSCSFLLTRLLATAVPCSPTAAPSWMLAGANIELQQADYLYASLPARGLGGSTIDVEFLCAKSDKTVAIRAATRRASLPDAGSCYKAIEEVRRRLGWEEVRTTSSHLASHFLLDVSLPVSHAEIPGHDICDEALLLQRCACHGRSYAGQGATPGLRGGNCYPLLCSAMPAPNAFFSG